VFAVAAAGVCVHFPPWWTHYLNTVSAADPVQIPLSLLFLELNDPDVAGAVLDDGKDVDLRAVEQVGGEEVQCQDPLRLGAKEFRPARATPARSPVDPRRS